MTNYEITEKMNLDAGKSYMAKAKNLTSAKRKASKNQEFSNTVLQICYPGEGVVISQKEDGIWTDFHNHHQ
jgi:hypothetical protein